MANILLTALHSILVYQLLIIAIEGKEREFGLKEEKMTHIQVYWQDVASGPKPSSLVIVKAPKNSPNLFGNVVVMDDALTIGPKLSSKIVGRAQGLLAPAAQGEIAALMAMNFVFTEGKYNGSTVAILGRNSIFSKVREMPIVGGTGLFRFASGYVQARTHKFDVKNGDATVEYNVFVKHY